jgi:hypothetical protein
MVEGTARQTEIAFPQFRDPARERSSRAWCVDLRQLDLSFGPAIIGLAALFLASRSNVQFDTSKIRALGMTFGSEALLRQTVQELIEVHRRPNPEKTRS